MASTKPRYTAYREELYHKGIEVQRIQKIFEQVHWVQTILVMANNTIILPVGEDTELQHT